jgi:two-component system, sensor histidine kinase YesM
LRAIRNSLRTRLLFSSFLGLAFLIVSVSYVLFATVRFQQVVNDQFRMERYFQDLQREVVAIREPLVDYLSSRSSAALADLLVEEQVLRSMIPEERPVSDDSFVLASREIFFLLESYLDLMHEAIALKRARAIEEYTALYETMNQLNTHITTRIDRISLYGLRRELTGYENLLDASRQLLFWNLLVLVSAFVSSVFLIFLSIKRITDPMHRLAQMAGELSSGNFDVEDIRIEAVTEVGTVVHAFNTMKGDIRQYIAEINKQKEMEQEYLAEKVRNLKMEQLLKRMELYTLQAQMNPHFLFNTLNTGVQLAITENAEQTADFMENLANFFRHNIRERDLIVPLRHEIEGLESYLYILRIRFPRSLELSLDVPEELLDACRVPALILQPLVENSVIHAFRGVQWTGAIDIQVRKEEEFVCLSVRDNGVGIPREIAERLLHPDSRDIDHSSKVMGLKNVIQRLHFFFPSLENVVTINGEEGTGTEVLIRLDTRVEACIPS